MVRGEPSRVLYIDDDPALRRLAQLALRRRGYAVELAEGAHEGVDKARANAFDLIVVDHYMPSHDGLATLAMLAEAGVQAPVIYVTGSEESRIAVAALKAGALDYVVKTPGDGFFDLLDSTFRQALEALSLRRQKEEAEAQLRASNERLEAMLSEVNHRVANSLQLVTSLVRLQASGITDAAARAALENTQQRIGAIAQVHRRLYTSDRVDVVDMAEYLTHLVRELEQAWSTPGSPRAVRLQAEPVRLKTDRAVSVGIIVNELVSNACKYAYPPGAPGEVRVTLQAEGEDRFRLIVEDDGCGMPDEPTPKGTGLGGKLVAAMTRTLQGELVMDPLARGVCASLSAAC
ncbi:MAG TPA: histidine kinase dimerization/phosphoacceptor domain -containing protein [Caulobacteraceae bacterium]|nr:histidine kinase dimerization/phosphoacceptor domain -containing protein [Caulobacteraceae bacterium]